MVPTLDCAPLVVARELGLYRAHGVDVSLSREVGWASIREKLLHEELDAAVAPASLLFTLYFGLGGVRRRPCLTGLLLGLHGSAITVSRAWWERGVRDPAALAEAARREAGRHRFVFGVVLELSAQHATLVEWLSRGGLRPGVDLDLAVVPAALMHSCLKAGHLDGCCVAEPWNSAAALAGDGVVVASSAELSPGHPDKALVVMQDLAEHRADEHERLLAALTEAEDFCAARENRAELIRMLARPDGLDVSPEVLGNALIGPFETGAGARPAGDWIRFDIAAAGAPSRAQGRHVMDSMLRLGSEDTRRQLRATAIRRIFREDIHAAAMRRARRRQEAGAGASAGAGAGGSGTATPMEDPGPRTSTRARPRAPFTLDQDCLSLICPTGVLV